MDITPTEIKQLIAENNLKQAIIQLHSLTEQLGLADLNNQIVIQSSRLQQYEKEKNLGSTDYSDLARTRVNISLALLNLVDQIQKHTVDNSIPHKKLPGISERKFKKQIMWLLIAGKLSIFLFIFTIWQSGGLTFDGFLGTMGIVFPVFATYLSLSYQEILKNRHQHISNDKLRVNRSVQVSSFLFFGVYYLGIFLVLYLNTIGAIPDPGKQNMQGIPSYKNLFAMLALVESFVGVYIGKIVFTLFKEKM
ncbi:MAG: hypothetical protein MI974_28255 [Chitinophagales bacterium]|nr:hypothetical protein [Chitinophagales bacterium]